MPARRPRWNNPGSPGGTHCDGQRGAERDHVALAFFQEVYVYLFHSRNLMAGLAMLTGLGGYELVRGARPLRPARRGFILVLCALALLLQLRYSREKVGVSFPWVEDARVPAAQLAVEDDLVVTCFADWYPLHALLGRPWVFPRSTEQKLSTHPWWYFSNAEQVEQVRETLDELCPGRTLGLLITLENQRALRLRGQLRAEGWQTRWSRGSLEVWVRPPQPPGAGPDSTVATLPAP